MSADLASGASRRHVAVDLGASGGRVALGTVANGRLEVEILHRFAYAPVSLRGGLYWDVLAIWREILRGLALAGQVGGVESVGVNSWAVDYGLIDAEGNLLDGVHHYRSPRNTGVMEAKTEEIGREAIYAATGLQFLPFNTAYQLVAHRRDAPVVVATAADRLLMVPDLFHFWLSGERSHERTNASTTGLYDPHRKDWSPAMLGAFGVPESLLGPISEPGTTLGPLVPEIAEATRLTGTRVVLPATHDTASAVVAVPATGDDDWAYVSSGTWSLVGIEIPAPIVTPEALRTNLTNEAGLGGTTRLLKNLMGLWILQECRRAWGDVPFETLYAEAEKIEDAPTFDPDDARFLAPGLDMPDRVRALAGVSERGEIVRAILESLARRTAEILDVLERVSGREIRTVHVVGGGSQIDLLNRRIAERSGRTVVAGPVEATLIGNLLVQAQACGSICPGTIREIVRAGTASKRYAP